MTKYNGHRSWNAWNISLWINNDEGLYSTARSYARQYGIQSGARRFFHECLEGEKTPDGASYNPTCVYEAMRDILS